MLNSVYHPPTHSSFQLLIGRSVYLVCLSSVSASLNQSMLALTTVATSRPNMIPRVDYNLTFGKRTHNRNAYLSPEKIMYTGRYLWYPADWKLYYTPDGKVM